MGMVRERLVQRNCRAPTSLILHEPAGHQTITSERGDLVNYCLGVRVKTRLFVRGFTCTMQQPVPSLSGTFGDLQTVPITLLPIHTVAAAVASRRPVATGSPQLPVKHYRIEVTECDWRQKDPSQGCSVSSACFSFEADVCVFLCFFVLRTPALLLGLCAL